LTAGLIWTIPAFTAALLSGQSQSSGFSILQQALGSFAGASQMFAQFGAANRQSGAAASNRADIADIRAHAAGAGGAQTASGLAAQPMAPQADVDRFQPAGAGAATSTNVAATGGATAGIGVTTGSNRTGPTLYDNGLTNQPQRSFPIQGAPAGGGDLAPVNPSTGMQYEPAAASTGGNNSLYDKSYDQIARMNRGEFMTAMRNSDYQYLSDEQRRAVAQFHAGDAQQVLGEQADHSNEVAELNRAYGTSGLAQAAPRDIGQPSAVQVRMSNPDRL
jgi:hypothetical protein